MAPVSDQWGRSAGVRIVQVSDCLGHRWAVDHHRRIVYYLDSLTPHEVAEAVVEAIAALTAHETRPPLRLVHSTRLTLADTVRAV